MSRAQNIYFIETPGLWLSVRAGELSLRQRNGAYVELPPKTRTIVAAAHGFVVTSAAVRHCLTHKIELLVSDDAAAFVSLFAPEPRAVVSRAALKLRARQHACAANPAECARIAKAIVAAKVKAEEHTKVIEKTFLAELRKAKTTDDARHVDATAAQVWWKQWQGFELRFKGPPVPNGGRTFHSRYIARRQGRLGELV